MKNSLPTLSKIIQLANQEFFTEPKHLNEQIIERINQFGSESVFKCESDDVQNKAIQSNSFLLVTFRFEQFSY